MRSILDITLNGNNKGARATRNKIREVKMSVSLVLMLVAGGLLGAPLGPADRITGRAGFWENILQIDYPVGVNLTG